MKAFLREKNSFVVVSPVPKEDIKNGLRLYLRNAPEHLEKIMVGDIKEGIIRYDIPEELRANVIRVELDDNTST